ncbi:MAG: hypothetical protein ABI197_04875 [Granulicella sp.]
MANALTPYAGVARIVERMVNVTEGNLMTLTASGSLGDCNTLIQQFHITLVSDDEASRPHDCVVKLGSDRRKRIDRQGPVQTGHTITHGKFAVQLGTALNAGIHLPVNETYSIDTIREAFRQSLLQRRYVRLFKETVID